MPSCDMCGKEGQTVKTIIEGTEMDVCTGCSKFGKRLTPPKFKGKQKFSKFNKPKVKSPIPEGQENLRIISSYGEVIKKKREQMGLKQEELAKKVSERESVINKMESGHFRPSIKLAKKLEKLLSIKLIEEKDAKKLELKNVSSSGGALTIGDLLKKKS